MLGRDIVKFVLSHDLMDKDVTWDNITFVDRFPDDSEIYYIPYNDIEGTYEVVRITYVDGSEVREPLDAGTILRLSYASMYGVDNLVDDTTSYSKTFLEWLDSEDTTSYVLMLIKQYLYTDPEFTQECTTLNQMLTYLEVHQVDLDTIQSAITAWFQYVRECRI